MMNLNSHKNIDNYIQYATKNPREVSDDVHKPIEVVVKPLLERDDIFFDIETYEI